VKPQPPEIALALAGGGPLGAVYEIGALVALSEAIDGLDLNGLDCYVGVSAGAFVTAGLANGMTPTGLARLVIQGESADGTFDPSVFLMPATAEYARRLARLPRLAGQGARAWLKSRTAPEALRERSPWVSAFARLAEAIPTGLFDNAALGEFLAESFSRQGRTDDFRQLRTQLRLVATDLDTGASMAFGAPGVDHVPISRAVQASAALPGLFPPVRIDGHWYVDGALKRTLHASVALEAGAKLVLCVNPLVPFDAQRAAAASGAAAMTQLVAGGLPTVLSQTFRSIIHSRLEVGMARYAREYPQSDVLLFEPDHGDSLMFFTNPFSYAGRRKLSEHAYQRTRADLRSRAAELGPVLARHGLHLRPSVLADEGRSLARHLGPMPRRGSRLADVAGQLEDTLDRLEQRLRHPH
jgi:NTE family protein